MAHLESLVVLDAAGRSGAALAFGFERAGYRVYATREADDALAMAQTRVPQLMVVSVDDGDALSFVGRLREDAPTRELPVVAVGESARREEALRAGVDEFVIRPAFIRDVLTLSRLAVAVRQDGDDGGVVGLLEDYGLYFLVRALAVAGRSCVMELERGRRIGEVQLAKGAVVAARVGRMTGVAAFQHLLLWGEASLSLRFESPAAERRIVATVDELLDSGARFAREFEAAATRVGGPLAIYAHEPRRAAEARSQIPAEVMSLVKLYDGRKPLIDIVEDSPFKAFDTIKITWRLAEIGAIARREARHATPLSERLALRDWLLGDGEEPKERPPSGPPGGVTEAGRRAAEAYAAEAARRAAEPSPAADILGDDHRPPASEEPGVHRPPASEEPGVDHHPPAASAESGVDVHRRPAREEPSNAESGEASTDVPTEAAPAAAPVPKPAAVKPAPVAKTAKKKKDKHGDKDKDKVAKKEPASPRSEPLPAKLSPHAAATAPPKEHVFDDLEEDFFAREADLWHAARVDSFDDLEPRHPSSPRRRDWFGLKKK